MLHIWGDPSDVRILFLSPGASNSFQKSQKKYKSLAGGVCLMLPCNGLVLDESRGLSYEASNPCPCLGEQAASIGALH